MQFDVANNGCPNVVVHFAGDHVYLQGCFQSQNLTQQRIAPSIPDANGNDFDIEQSTNFDVVLFSPRWHFNFGNRDFKPEFSETFLFDLRDG